jgi:hypothetical protein
MSIEKSFSEQHIRAQLERIFGSPAFANSARLKDFLGYIVDEAMAGRAGRIKGVTIAQSVFGADQSFDPETNSIVRVEAGRLRRRLSEYYAGAGHHDPILISVPKGSYAPAFSPNPERAAEPTAAASTDVGGSAAPRSWPRFVLPAALAGAVLVWFLVERQGEQGGAGGPAAEAVTGITTESRVLFDQAFRVLMPPEDKARMDAAQLMFGRVIELEPDFAGGYSGKSLTHAIKVLFLKSDDRAADLEQARTLARQALEVDDEYGLAYSALAVAHALGANEEQALANARRALTAEQQDASANAMAALGLLVAGHPQEAADFLQRAMRLNPESPRTPYLNLLGIAYYAAGDYEAAAATFEENVSRGGPVGPHMDVFVGPTYGHLGREFEARAVVERLQRTHPDYPVAGWLANYLKSEAALDDTLDRLRQLGWTGS